MENDEIYIVIDFLPNYVCGWAEEVHSVHFGASQRQVSIQSGGYYDKGEDGEIYFKSFATLSENLDYDALAVWTHLQPVFAHIQKLKSSVKTIHIQSDGPKILFINWGKKCFM